MNLTTLNQSWTNMPAYHTETAELFTKYVNEDDRLNEHRTWVEQNIHGFGERAFWWLWKVLLKELDSNPALMEIGVYKGATLSVWRLLRPDSLIIGITPLDSSDGHYDLDYISEIERIHNNFYQPMPLIFHGRSDAKKIVDIASKARYDLIYIDGSHQRIDVDHDLSTYPQMVKPGGYLVIDDCNCDLNFPPSGFFTGIQDVTDAKLAWLASDPPFEFVFSVVHIAVFRRVGA